MTRLAGFISCVGLMLWMGTASASFSYRKSITIDRSKAGDAGTTTLSNFPLFYKVTDTDLRSTANGGDVESANGYDIIFRALDSTTCGGPSTCDLPHQIERYDASTGDLEAWVTIPVLNGPSAASDTVIYVYYGNPDIVSSTEQASSVWADGYRAVYHFDETTGGTGAVQDSTSYGNHLTDVNGPTLGGTGFLGPGIQLDGVNDYLEAPTSSSLEITGSITLSMWVNLGSTDDPQIGVTKPPSDTLHTPPFHNYSLHFLRVSSSSFRPRFFLTLGGSARSISTSTTMSTSTWTHVTGTYDGSTLRVYQNGELRGSLSNSGAIANSGKKLRIGTNGSAASEFLANKLDELRICACSRSAGFVKAEFNNQSAPASFYTVGSEGGPGVLSAVRYEGGRAQTLPEGDVRVTWQTGWESETLGYRVYRLMPDATLVRVTPELVPGPLLGGTGPLYEAFDRNPGPPARRYIVEDVDAEGVATRHPPIDVEPLTPGASRAPASRPAVFALAASRATPLENTNAGILSPLRESPLTTKPWTPPEGALALTVSRAGWQRVDQATLAAAGWDVAADPGGYGLWNDGTEIPLRIREGGDGSFDPEDHLAFWGQPRDTRWEGTSVYWVAPRGGTRRVHTQILPTVSGLTEQKRALGDELRQLRLEPSTPSYLHATRLTERTRYLAAILDGEGDNFFGAVLTKTPLERTLPIHHRQAGPTGEERLELVLQGISQGDHAVTIELNDVPVGQATFRGRVAHTFMQPVVLREGDNLVRLVRAGDETDVAAVSRVALVYRRRLVADADQLTFSASGGRTVTLAGFSSRNVEVIDVTSPDEPVWLDTRSARLSSRGHAVEVTIPGAGTRHVVATARPFELRDTRSASASAALEAGEGAHVVMIGPASLAPAMERLAEQRRREGLLARVEDVRTLYEQFAYGHKTPWAIRNFLRWAGETWPTPPRYVVLFGDATFDPRDHLGKGQGDLVPTLFFDAPTMETATDELFGDLDGDGRGDVAVGRLPARTLEEAELMVRKVLGFSPEVAAPLNDLLLVAGFDGSSLDFPRLSASVGASAPASARQESLVVTPDLYLSSRTRFSEALSRSAKVVNYFGHGSVGTWSGTGFMTSAQARELLNDKPPVFSLMTCLNGMFQDVFTESLAEALLRAPAGGAVAVFSSSTLTEPISQTELARGFVGAALGGTAPRLGDAVQAGKDTSGPGGVRLSWNLLGDPSMPLLPPSSRLWGQAPPVPQTELGCAYARGDATGAEAPALLVLLGLWLRRKRARLSARAGCGGRAPR